MSNKSTFLFLFGCLGHKQPFKDLPDTFQITPSKPSFNIITL